MVSNVCGLNMGELDTNTKHLACAPNTNKFNFNGRMIGVCTSKFGKFHNMDLMSHTSIDVIALGLVTSLGDNHRLHIEGHPTPNTPCLPIDGAPKQHLLKHYFHVFLLILDLPMPCLISMESLPKLTSMMVSFLFSIDPY